MRSKTPLEVVTHRGEVRLEISVPYSSLEPRWFEFVKRARWWRLCHRVLHDRTALSTETQIALYWAEEALEREFRLANKEM